MSEVRNAGVAGVETSGDHRVMNGHRVRPVVSTASARTDGSGRRAAPCVDAAPDRQVRLRVHYRGRNTARLWLIGEVDLTNTERVRELIHSRLRSQLRTLELDLSHVTFLSLSGARMLAHAAVVAPDHGTELCIRPNLSHAARAALHISGLAPDRGSSDRTAEVRHAE